MAASNIVTDARRVRGSSAAPRGTMIPRGDDVRHRKVLINVGGERHEPYISTLQNIPDSPLAWILRKECHPALDFNQDTGEYFFDRHPGVFSQVLHYFQTGKLHCPRDVCGPLFQKELNFWGIDETQMEACCWPAYTTHREIQENLKMFHFVRPNCECNDESKCTGNHKRRPAPLPKWKAMQRSVWEVLDEPYSSNIAQGFAYVSLGFIILSVVSFTMMSLEEFRGSKECSQIKATGNNNLTTACSNDKDSSESVVVGFETLGACWFTLEIALRCVFSPCKSEFFRNLSNWVDLLAVIPVYLVLLCETNDLILILNMIRLVRVFRFFKLLYDLHILGKTLQASMHQLAVLLLVLAVPVVIFSSMVYYTEHFLGSERSKDDFPDIPSSFWWAIITMCTIGYGDIAPESVPGKVLAGMAAVVGVIILSLTASVIGSSFQQYYNVARTQMKIPAKKKALVKAVSQTTLRNIALTVQKEQSDTIKSNDSKDSGYGRSPQPQADIEGRNSPRNGKKFVVEIERQSRLAAFFSTDKLESSKRRCSMLV